MVLDRRTNAINLQLKPKQIILWLCTSFYCQWVLIFSARELFNDE